MNINQLDPELQAQLMKDGEVQREKIDADVEKLLEASLKGYFPYLLCVLVHYSYIKSNVATVKEVLKKKEDTKDFVNEHDANKRTALHFAVFGDKLDVIKVLLENKADVNALDWVFFHPLLLFLLAHFLTPHKGRMYSSHVGIKSRQRKCFFVFNSTRSCC